MAKNLTQIALVDDHTLLRNGLASIVQSFDGYSVMFEADNGKDFIEQLKKYDTPDIVLLDINMPEMDGYETAQKIRELEKSQNLAHTPIVAMTAHAMQGDRELCLAAGMDGYISKPVDTGKLKNMLEQVIQSGTDAHCILEQAD